MNKIPGTTIEVSGVCFGTMSFGVPVNEANAIELIHYARDRGINFIDSANMYEGYSRFPGSHGGVAEKIIAKAVKGERDKYVITTKFGMKVGDEPEDEGCSPAALERHLDRSLRYLDTDYIDIYFAHKYDPSVPAEELCFAMKKAVDSGKIRYWGVSNYNGAQLEELIGAAGKNSLVKPVLYQPHLSILQQDALTDGIDVCAREKIGVMPYRVLQGGLLGGTYRRGEAPPKGSRAADSNWLTLDDDMFTRIEEIEAIAKADNMTMIEYAMRWVMTGPAVVSFIVGFRNKEQIDLAAAVAGL